MDLLNEKEKYFDDADALKQRFDKDKDQLMKQLETMDGQGKQDPAALIGTVDARIDEKLAQNKPALVLPKPVFEYVIKEKELDGDDEYWL